MLDSSTAAELLMLYISININNCMQEFQLKINLNPVADNDIVKSLRKRLQYSPFLCCWGACKQPLLVQLPRKVHEPWRYLHTVQDVRNGYRNMDWKKHSFPDKSWCMVHFWVHFSLSISLETYNILHKIWTHTLEWLKKERKYETLALS